MDHDLGADFANAVAAKDHDRVRALIHAEVDFQAMTPGEFWHASCPDEIVGVLDEWFGEDDLIEAVELLDCDGFADRKRVGYRLRVKRPDGQHLIEQQAYLSERDGQIGWLRIMCSGYRRADATTSATPQAKR
ncbi:MAG TPA: hypothetical protein VFF32_07615 [Dermatophilaceae bacterium]|nr:hypothetical protein [Dermatophilaceae bacterium]